jgi:hypothetical protein
MPKPEKSLRQQLLDARSDVKRQIEILQSGPLVNARGGGPDFKPAIASLTATLKEIDNSLADLGENEA